jgi:hypothetical protein
MPKHCFCVVFCCVDSTFKKKNENDDKTILIEIFSTLNSFHINIESFLERESRRELLSMAEAKKKGIERKLISVNFNKNLTVIIQCQRAIFLKRENEMKKKSFVLY